MESTEMHEWVPTLTHATERDIDLLLVEELTASRAFLAFVAAHVGWTELPSVWRVLHSKRRIRNRREIDIHVEITASSKTATLLIENKLDASEQPDQAESYREELLRITETSNTFAATLLICPCDYAAQHHVFAAKFDAVLNYEALSAWLRERSEKLVDAETSARLRFRSEMLEQAVGKARRGYLPVPNQVIGGFNARYVQLLAQLAPDIQPGPSMLKEANPDESVSMIFNVATSLMALAPQIRPRRFAHEFGRNRADRANYVAVAFAGWGVQLGSVEEHLRVLLSNTNLTVAAAAPNKNRPNPALILSLPVPAVDNQGSFDQQRQQISEGIEAARHLRDWLLENEALLWRMRALCLGDN